jgi:hypothetical protein
VSQTSEVLSLLRTLASLSDVTEKLTATDRRILAHLTDRTAAGERYFRAKHIAEWVGLSPQQVGARLPKLAVEAEDLEISKWSRHRSTTWRVQPR